jgi:hypothetical protein
VDVDESKSHIGESLLYFEKTRLLLQYFADVFGKSSIHPSARNTTQTNELTSVIFSMVDLW